jgi:hypothetical protein
MATTRRYISYRPQTGAFPQDSHQRGNPRLIRELPDIECEWIEDDSLRKTCLAELLHSCETRKLAQWIKMIHHRKIELEKRDKKLSGSDAEP